jgi:DNA mismatch repair ATPase MutS
VDKLTDELSGIQNDTLKQELAAIKKDVAVLRPFAKGAILLSPSDASGGGLSELFMEYVRMLTHIDLIRFNNIYKLFTEHQDELNSMFARTGLLDATRAVASYRTLKGKYCVPVLHEEASHTLKTMGIGHPLIDEPVVNSIAADRPVLLTGSNASGKSTFLKTLAVNAIFAQTIHTVLADRYEADYFHILSSMALRDDIETQESYYIVEIRSLKRIMDASEGNVSVLCFVDEVLRGTNTAERIAASSRILRYLAERKALVFAATHDLELTSLLSDVYDNYHFSEQVKEDIVVFDYQLKPGKATSRNALKLLKMMDYPEQITDEANQAVETFLTTGEWK